MATEYVHLPNPGDLTAGYSSLTDLLDAIEAWGLLFPFAADVDVGHSNGVQDWRVYSWSYAAATGTQAAALICQHRGVTPDPTDDLFTLFHVAPGALAGSDPATVAQRFLTLAQATPAFAPAKNSATQWHNNIYSSLYSLGAFESSPTTTLEYIVSTEGGLAGKTCFARGTVDYNPSAGEYAIGIGQLAWQGFWVASDVDLERAIDGGAAVGSTILQDPQVVIQGSAQAEGWGDLSGAAVDQADELALIREYAKQSYARNPMLMGALPTLTDRTPQAGDADKALVDDLIAWSAANPAPTVPSTGPILSYSGGGVSTALVAVADGALETISSAPGLIVAAIGAAAMAARAAYNWFTGNLTSLANLSTIADKMPSPSAAYDPQDFLIELVRIADALEAIQEQLTPADGSDRLAEHLKDLSVSSKLISENASEVSLSFKGVRATARTGAVEVET